MLPLCFATYKMHFPSFWPQNDIYLVDSLPNPLSDDKILDLSKMEAFADNNVNVTHMLQFYSDRSENIVGKGENTGYQHFLLFPQYFIKLLFKELENTGCLVNVVEPQENVLIDDWSNSSIVNQ